MTTITLFEHQEISYKELGWEHSPSSLALLEKINETYKIEIIHLGRYGLKALQYVGIIQAGKLSIQILPKIDYLGNTEASLNTNAYNDASSSAAANLLSLLSYAQNIKLYAQNQSQLRSATGNWFELLTRLFALELHQQLKRGLEHNYKRIEERSSALRGTWEIQKQILRLPHEQHLFDTIYDEFLPDTPLNRVFLFVSQKLRLLTRDHENKRLLGDIISWFSDVAPLATICKSSEHSGQKRDFAKRCFSPSISSKLTSGLCQ